ncbi:MAG: 2-oxoacid:acceptor oxidoreductase subunit alpha [Myxococcota bacterium]
MRTVDDGSSGSKPVPDKAVTQLEDVAIRFVGDSGDGMQITGSRFTDTAALFGNDVATFPDFPAEIRAPAGTLAGVSGYQVHFAAEDIFTPGDVVDLLVAFNPAALRANIDDVRSKGMVILNSNSLTKKSLTRAGYTDDPLPELRERYEVVEIPITTLNREALQGLALSAREIDRCKNFFALGLLYWLYHRDLDFTERWLASRFDGDVLKANIRTLRAGHAFGETTELLPTSFVVPATKIEPGPYRNITGNAALAWGIVAAGVQMERPVFLGAYPITPASDVLHEVARHRHFDVKTFQAEDEMAAASAAVGAAFAGHLAISVSSGPGFILKQETLGLAVMVELPLVVVDVQRAGPSTGSPTKTEQGDLLAALYGRHSQSPLPILAPATPGDCFYIMLEAFRLATKYMTPVVVLSDGYLANSAEPWKIPSVETLPRAPVRLAQASDAETFEPYERDPETLARPWAIPGTPGLEHRIGGLTKAPVTGDVVYDPISHAEMVQLRQRKIEGITRDIPPTEVNGPNRGELLVLGWGSTHGVITAAIKGARERGLDVSHAHLRHLNPLPSDLGELLGRFNHILLPELNLGQLSMLLRAKYLIDIEPFTKVAGQPFKVSEVQGRIEQILEGNGK